MDCILGRGCSTSKEHMLAWHKYMHSFDNSRAGHSGSIWYWEMDVMHSPTTGLNGLGHDWDDLLRNEDTSKHSSIVLVEEPEFKHLHTLASSLN